MVKKSRLIVGLALVALGLVSGCNSTEVPIVQFPASAKTAPPPPPSSETKAAAAKSGISQGDPSVDTR